MNTSAYTGPKFDPDRQPEWGVERVSQQYGLTCPHCSGKMLVNRHKWLDGAIPSHWDHQDIFSVLRACTYCCQTARIPSRLLRK